MKERKDARHVPGPYRETDVVTKPYLPCPETRTDLNASTLVPGQALSNKRARLIAQTNLALRIRGSAQVKRGYVVWDSRQ